MMAAPPAPGHVITDRATAEWLRGLRAGGTRGDAALAHLHELLLGAARFELRRRSEPDAVVDALAHEAADSASVDVRARLSEFSGESSFTTWAAKFAIVAAAVRSRRRAWAGRELPQSNAYEALARIGLAESERIDVAAALGTLPADQRRVLIALALEDVPIDVLAERDGTSRAALHETLQEARLALRARLGARWSVDEGEHVA